MSASATQLVGPATANVVATPKVPLPFPSSTETLAVAVANHHQIGRPVPVDVSDGEVAQRAPGRIVRLRPKAPFEVQRDRHRIGDSW
jgi:hypothetical protein